MSRVRAGYGSRTVGAGQQVDDADGNRGVPAVLCSGHLKKARRFTATTNKNAGRAFYTCAKGREDPERCKFFVWEDEIDGKAKSTETASASRAAQIATSVNQTGGQRLGSASDTATPTVSRLAGRSGMITPQTGSRAPVEDEEQAADDIAWDKVDTDTLEADAIASTPASSQKVVESIELRALRGESSLESFADRLRSAQDGTSKRKRDEEDSAVTPRRALQGNSNPFISSTPGRNVPHTAMTETLTSLEKLSNELHRRDRLLTAAESAKMCLRKTIEGLQKRNSELEARNAELEQQLRRRS